MSAGVPVNAITSATAPASGARRTLLTACGAHVLHDGYADLLYVLLPLWRAEFVLGYAAIGLLRAMYACTMAGFQVPASLLAERLGDRVVLVLGTALAGAGFLVAGMSGGFFMLSVALVIGGLGASVQHPLASNLVAHAYADRRAREALGTYNFSGDLGKMLLPALTAWLLTMMPWRSGALVLGALGFVAAALLALFLPRRSSPSAAPSDPATAAPAPETGAAAAIPMPGGGFRWLLTIGVIDSATRMAFLTFLPFLLQAKGADLPTIGVALTLVFAGGAAGKFVCGFLGARVGVLTTICLTEGLTALSILLLLPLPLAGSLALLPVVGSGVERHVIRSLRHGARAGPGGETRAGVRHFLHRHDRRRGALADRLRRVQRQRRHPHDDGAHRLPGAAHSAADPAAAAVARKRRPAVRGLNRRRSYSPPRRR